MISMAFDKIDPEGTGEVALAHLANCYCADKHPHVLSRRKSPEEVFDTFMTGMTLKANGDVLSRAGFVDYYADINFCVPA